MRFVISLVGESNAHLGLKDRAWRWRGSGMKCESVSVHVCVCVVCVGGRDKIPAEAKLPQVLAQMKGQDLG